jgi:hypothetical protein
LLIEEHQHAFRRLKKGCRAIEISTVIV